MGHLVCYIPDFLEQISITAIVHDNQDIVCAAIMESKELPS